MPVHIKAVEIFKRNDGGVDALLGGHRTDGSVLDANSVSSSSRGIKLAAKAVCRPLVLVPADALRQGYPPSPAAPGLRYPPPSAASSTSRKKAFCLADTGPVLAAPQSAAQLYNLPAYSPFLFAQRLFFLRGFPLLAKRPRNPFYTAGSTLPPDISQHRAGPASAAKTAAQMGVYP